MITLLKRLLLLSLITLSLVACKALAPIMETVKPMIDLQMGGNAQGITNTDMITAIKQALSQGVADSVKLLGSAKGFNLGNVYHIPIPQQLQKPASLLRRIGQGKRVDEFENRLNLAAQASVKQAIPVFTRAIRNMSVKDALGILKGSDNAATQYFKTRTSTTLRQKFLPVIQKATSQTGLTNSYKSLVTRVLAISPRLADQAVDIDQYILDHSMNALFDRIAIEEQQIRKDPAKRTTELMKSVFGHFSK